MKDTKRTIVIAAVIYIIAGLILLIIPTLTAHVIAYTVATLALVFGIFQLASYFISKPYDFHKGFLIGAFSIFLSIFIYCRVDIIISIIPIILGFVISFSGISTLQQTFDLIRIKQKGWVALLVGSIVNIILGVIAICNPFTTAIALMCLIGVGLIFSGISDIAVVLFLSDKIKKNYF